MSEREFEHYLSLLGSLLRLRGGQRAEIAEELRQHLDERLADLQAAGLSRDDAIQQALAEFGDAAGLAAQFSWVRQQKYRRWMMRAATTSITSAFMVLVLFLSFWPAGGRVALLPPMTAQDQAGGEVQNAEAAVAATVAKDDPFAGGPAAAVQIDASRRTREAKSDLARRRLEELEVGEFHAAIEDVFGPEHRLQGISFSDLGPILSQILPYGCIIDRRSLEDHGVDPEADVDLSVARLNEASLATILELLLEQVDLTYVVRDGIVEITTEHRASENLSLVMYDARAFYSATSVHPFSMDLLGPPPVATSTEAGGSTTSRESQRNAELLKMDTQFSRVSKLLQVQVDPDSWEENGGVGNVSAVNSILLIRQTERNHRRLRKLFDELERITQ